MEKFLKNFQAVEMDAEEHGGEEPPTINLEAVVVTSSAFTF